MKRNMNPLFRTILGTIAGVVAGSIMVAISEKVGHTIYPTTAGIDFNDLEVLADLIANMPLGAFLFVLLGYGLGAFAGSVVGGLIGGRIASILAGATLCLFGLIVLMMIPHPPWFGPSVLVVNGLGTTVGLRLLKAFRGDSCCA